MVGKPLTQLLLSSNYRVIILSRTLKRSSHINLSYATWDVSKGEIDIAAIQEADIIVHLAGEGVADKRWSTKRKEAIVNSRVHSGALLVKTLSENKHKVKTVIAASAIGWYGPDTEKSSVSGFKEDDACDDSYLGNTCKLWEQSMNPLNSMGIRLVTFRIGIVFNRYGGALAAFIKPAQLGLATILGSGRQMVSWIHQYDLCKMIGFAIQNPSLKGVYNAVSPYPINNKNLAIEIAKKIRHFYVPIPVPSFILKIMLGEMSIEVLKSATVSSKKIEEAGFHFSYPTVDKALDQLLK